VQEALDKAKLTERNLSAIAVTIGPGLGLCLRGKVTITFVLFPLLFNFPVLYVYLNFFLPLMPYG